MVKQAKARLKTPQRPTAASDAASKQSAAAPNQPAKPNLDLFMECVDEDLTPSQMEANRKAAIEYTAAIEQIKAVSRQPPIAPPLSVKRFESPEVIVVDDDEPQIISTAGLHYNEQLLTTRASGVQVCRAPVTAFRSIACAPAIPPSSSSSIVTPQMFFSFPAGAANQPMLLPAGFAQVQIISPVAASSSVIQKNFRNSATLPAQSQPVSIAPNPLQLIRPSVTSSVWSVVEPMLSQGLYQGRNCYSEVLHRSTGTSPIPFESLERQESPSPELDDGEEFYFDDDMASESLCDDVQLESSDQKRRTRRGRPIRRARRGRPRSVVRPYSTDVQNHATYSASQPISFNAYERKLSRYTLTTVASNYHSHHTQSPSPNGIPSSVDLQKTDSLSKTSPELPTVTPLRRNRGKNIIQHIKNAVLPSSQSVLYNNMSMEGSGQPYILNVWSERDNELSFASGIDGHRKDSMQSRISISTAESSVTTRTGKRAVQPSTTVTRKNCSQSKVTTIKKVFKTRAKSVPGGSDAMFSIPFETRSGKKWLNTQWMQSNKLSGAKNNSLQSKYSNNVSHTSVSQSVLRTRSGKVILQAPQIEGIAQHKNVLGVQSEDRRFSSKELACNVAKKPELTKLSTVCTKQVPSANDRKLGGSNVILKLRKRRHLFSVERAQNAVTLNVTTAKEIVIEKSSSHSTEKSKFPTFGSSAKCTRSSAKHSLVLTSKQSLRSTRQGNLARFSRLRVGRDKLSQFPKVLAVELDAEQSRFQEEKVTKVLIPFPASDTNRRSNLTGSCARAESSSNPACNKITKACLPIGRPITRFTTCQSKINLPTHILQKRLSKQSSSKRSSPANVPVSVNEANYPHEGRRSGRLGQPQQIQSMDPVTTFSQAKIIADKNGLETAADDKCELSVTAPSKQVLMGSNDSTSYSKQSLGRRFANASVRSSHSEKRTRGKIDMWKKYGFKQSSLYKSMMPKDDRTGYCGAIPSDVGLRSVLECVEGLASDRKLDETEKDKHSKSREHVQQQQRAHAHNKMKLHVKSTMQSRLMQNRMHTRNVASGQGEIVQQLAQSSKTPKLTIDVKLKTSEQIPKSTASINSKNSKSWKKAKPAAPSVMYLDSVLESVARGQSSKKRRGRPRKILQPPEVLQQEGQEDKFDDPIITVDDEDGDSDSNWVPLDEYYYGQKDGDPSYREDKRKLKFKCWLCDKMFDNNLHVMSHIQGHIDGEKQQNFELASLTRCTHCTQQFSSPFEMQCHVEKVHQNQSSILSCHICEKDFKNEAILRQHMKQTHRACEMPYVCQLCGFRSSVYNDVVDHFKKRHDCTANLLCLYCLKTVKTVFYPKIGHCQTSGYYQHVIKHLDKGNERKCQWCKLTFFNKMHSLQHVKDHASNFRGVPSSEQSTKDSGFKLDTVVPRSSASELVMIPLPQVPKVKLLNAPKLSSQVDMSGLRLYGVESNPRCLECGKAMDTSGHYQRYLACTMCRFATVCGNAYLNHMARFHRGKSQVQVDGVLSDSRKRQNTKMHGPTYCLCGFSSYYGTVIANHLVSCSKRTCYRNMPEQKWSEYDDEKAEFNSMNSYNNESGAQSPERDVPTLFGALGLVKKTRRAGHTRHHGRSTHVLEMSPRKVASEIIDDILDVMFPAEAAASEILSMLMDAVDKTLQSQEIKSVRKNRMASNPAPCGGEVPAELTGSRKWSTVKISDEVLPSVSSIFLGCEMEEKMDVDPDSSSSTKAEDCIMKAAGDCGVDQTSNYPAAVANYLVDEVVTDRLDTKIFKKAFETADNGLSTDRCSDTVSAKEPMSELRFSNIDDQMDECLEVCTSNTNSSIKYVTESLALNTSTSTSGFYDSEFESRTIDDKLSATIVSEELVNLNKYADNHAAHYEASIELKETVTFSKDVSVELTGPVALEDNIAVSNVTPRKKVDRDMYINVDVGKPDVIDTVGRGHASEHQGSSNLVTLSEQGLDSIDLQAVEVESVIPIVSKETLSLVDDVDSSDLPAKCGDDEFAVGLNPQLLSCEDPVNCGSVLGLDTSEFLSADGVQENTVCEFIDELISLPAPNTVNPQLLLCEGCVENNDVNNDARKFENSADTEAVGSYELIVSSESISMSKSDVWTGNFQHEQSKKCDAPAPSEGRGKKELTEIAGGNAHELTTFSAGTNVAAASDGHSVILENSVDATEGQLIHQVPSTQHSDVEAEPFISFKQSTQKIITGQEQSLPATASEELSSGINVTPTPLTSLPQESLTTSTNRHGVTSHSVADQQKEELWKSRSTVGEEMKKRDFAQQPPESKQEERKDSHSSSSYNRGNFDQRNNQRGYHHSQQNWRGGHNQTGFNQQGYGRQQDHWGYQGQDTNRRGNSYGSQNRGGHDDRYFQHGDDRRFGSNRGGYRGGNYGGGYYDRR